MPTKHTKDTNETDIFFSEIFTSFRVLSGQNKLFLEGRKSSQRAMNLAYSVADLNRPDFRNSSLKQHFYPHSCPFVVNFVSRARARRASVHHLHPRFLEARPRNYKCQSRRGSDRVIRQWQPRRRPRHCDSATISNRSHLPTADPTLLA